MYDHHPICAYSPCQINWHGWRGRGENQGFSLFGCNYRIHRQANKCPENVQKPIRFKRIYFCPEDFLYRHKCRFYCILHCMNEKRKLNETQFSCCSNNRSVSIQNSVFASRVRLSLWSCMINNPARPVQTPRLVWDTLTDQRHRRLADLSDTD